MESKNNLIRIEQIVKYFKNLCDKLAPTKEKAENNVLVLITRKGYFLLKTMMDFKKELADEFDKKGLHYWSDRYVLKDIRAFEESKFYGKNIYIFDDSITNGNNMFYYYCMFRKKSGCCVYPIVFAASAEFFVRKESELANYDMKTLPKRKEYERIFKKDLEVENSFQNLLKEFYRDLQFNVVLPADEIAELSIQESLWFQENLNPMVMDLPIYRGVEEKKPKPILLCNEEFELICKSTNKWQYVHNPYNGLKDVIQCDFFQLNDELLYQKFHDLFFNFVVKIKYKKTDKGVKIIFIPFAMIKSGSIKSIWRCFSSLMCDTDYYKEVINRMKSNPGISVEEYLKNNHNMCRGIFRSVIFSLSLYVGYLFQEKIKEDIGKEFLYDFEYLREHSDDCFVNTFENEYQKFNKEEFVKKIELCKYHNYSQLSFLEDFILEKEEANEEKVEIFVRKFVLNAKYEQEDRKKKIATIEDLEEELDKKFLFLSKEQKRLYLTKTLIMLLELSCTGNEIVVSNGDGIIYRGFRAGENSEILMPEGLKWIYPFVFAFYFYDNERFFVENYTAFKQWVLDLFYIREYIGSLISKTNLDFFLDYFEGVKENYLHEQILNKAYVLKDYWGNLETREGRAFVEEAFFAVKDWGDYIHVTRMD